MKESILRQKSYSLAIDVVHFCRVLVKSKEYVISKQLLRSGTGIGALLSEAEFGQSDADFVNKISIALKEANETKYWISLLRDTGYTEESEALDALQSKCKEIIAMLVASLKTLKRKKG